MARRRRSERARARAMAGFVAALEKGAHVIAAAQAAGVHVSTPYRWRATIPGFAEAWEEAVALSARPVLIAPANGRRLQKRRTRRLRFTPARKEAFLTHFAGTCDAKAAAAAAGVCESTVHKHLRADAAFAEGWLEAMEMGHQLLRAELVAEQIAARERYKAAPVAERGAADAEAAGQSLPLPAQGQASAGERFERSLKLLESWQRRDDSLARRAARTGGWGSGRPRWWEQEPPIEEVRAEILRRIEAISRHRRAEEAQQQGDGQGWAAQAGDGPCP